MGELNKEGSAESEIARQLARAKAMSKHIKVMQEKGAGGHQIRKEINKANKHAKREKEKLRKQRAAFTAKKFDYKIRSQGGNFFSSKLVINDYPQYARKKIMYRSEKEQIREWFQVQI